MIENIKKSYFNPTQSLTLATRIVAILPPALLEELNLSESVTQINANIAQLDSSLSNTQKSDYTQKLIEADAICDNAVRFLSSCTKSYQYSHVAEKTEAATLLYDVIKQHIPQISDLGYVNEMAKIEALHTELQEEKYVNAATELALQDDIAHLKASRDAFEALYLEKNIAEKDKSASISAKEASANVLEALQELINRLNANVLLNPSDALTELASSFNSVLDAVSKASK